MKYKGLYISHDKHILNEKELHARKDASEQKYKE